MPIDNLKAEEQRLIDNISYYKRQISDLQKQKGELEAAIAGRNGETLKTIQERIEQVAKMENEVKAINLETKMEVERATKNITSARAIHLAEDKRLAEKEIRLARFQKDLLESAKKAVGNVEHSEEMKAAAERMKSEIEKGLKDLEEKRQEVELRIQTLAIQQEDVFQIEKELEIKKKQIAEQDQTSRQSVMKSLSEEMRIRNMAKELEGQKQEILSLQSGIDNQMASIKEVVDRLNAQSIELTKDREEVKGLRQTLMDRMVNLDKREALLKQREGGN